MVDVDFSPRTGSAPSRGGQDSVRIWYTRGAAANGAASSCCHEAGVDARGAVMYAILETGGKQYKVQPGDVIEVERLDGEVGDQIELGRVLMLAADDAAPKLGNPVVAGVKVFGEVVEQGKGEKLIIFKYKNKVR